MVKNTSAGNDATLGVVVGFDGSPHAIDALYWGARAATRRGVPLTVASTYLFPYTDYLHDVTPDPARDPSHQIAEQQLVEARELLEQQQYEGEVNYQALVGDAATWLVTLSADAQLLVLGQRGLGKFWGRVLGSVSSAVPAHAQCPTVVVHSPEQPDGEHGDAAQLLDQTGDSRPVCVGVDNSDNARAAARVAAEEAKRLGVRLEVVQAQPPFAGTSSVWYLESDPKIEQEIHNDILEFLTAEIADLQQHVQDVEMFPVVVRGTPAEAMIECTERAQLTVLGTRGHGGFTSLLLGSVSRSALSHASGTVMVVPTPKA